MARRNASILDSIRRGDRVTIVNRFGQERTGTAVMRGPHGWVLNMGGRYGTPAVATEANIVKVREGRRNAGPRRKRGNISIRKAKKAARAEGTRFRKIPVLRAAARRAGRPLTGRLEMRNAPRVKGRRVKGGRAVSLRNFTGTIVRKSDGTVNILGRGRKR